MTLMTTTITPADLSTDLAPVEHEGQQLFDARVLHARLGSTTRFNDWMARRIKEYGFEVGPDFHSILSKSTGGRARKEYLITLDMAKTLVEQGQAHMIPQSFFSAQEALAMEQRLLEAIQKALPGNHTIVLH